MFVNWVNFVAAKHACAAASGLCASCQQGGVAGSFPGVVQVEPEARLSGAGTESLWRSSVGIVLERERCEVCPLPHFLFPSSSYPPAPPSHLAT